jgi:ribonucleoside-diphosphate reductase beta chain
MILDPGFEPHAAADALSGSTRCTATRSEHLDGGGGRLLDRRRRPAQDEPAERHLIERLVAFFATGDSIVANNLVLNLYKHINAPEARMYLSRQLYEEALHVQFYLTCSTPTCPDPRSAAPPSRRSRTSRPSSEGRLLLQVDRLDPIADALETRATAAFLLNLICFAACIEGLFFFAAFAYVYFLRSRGLLQRAGVGHELGVPRRERAHGLRLRGGPHRAPRGAGPVRRADASAEVREMMADAIDCEARSPRTCWPAAWWACRCATCASTCSTSPTSASRPRAWRRRYGTKNPLPFMDLQDVQELTNFFERRVSAYQVGVSGEVVFDEAF